MTFWDNLISASGSLISIATKDALNPLGMSWAIGQSSADIKDAAAKGGFLAGLARASQAKPTNAAGLLGLPNPDPMEALGYPLNYLVARPISTAIAAQPISDESNRSIFDASVWQDAWNTSANRSPAQSAMMGVGIGPNAWTNSDEDVKARKTFFEDTWYGRASSGLLDGLLDWFGDPLIVGGKLAKGATLGQKFSTAEDAANTVALLRKETVPTQVTKGQISVAEKMATLIQSTDNMNFDQLMTHPIFAKSGDTGAVAAMFDEANKIPDPGARFAAKADIMGVLQGNKASMDRLANQTTDLSAQVKRFLQPVKESNHAQMFRINDLGHQEMVAINGVDAEKEILARQDEINSTLARLERFDGVAGGTRQVTPGLGETVAWNMRADRVRETLLVNGPGSRPFRVIYGATGATVPGHVDLTDAVKGYEQFAASLSKDRWMSAAAKQDFLREYAKAVDKPARFKVVNAAEAAMYTAAGQKYGLKANEVQALLAATTGVRRKWRSALEERAYSGKPIIIDPDGEGLAFNGPWVGSQIQNTIPFTDARALDWALKKHTQTRWIETLARQPIPIGGGGQFLQMNVNQAANAANKAEATWEGMNNLLSSMMRPWKFAALFRVAYPQRVQVDSQLRNIAVLGPIQWSMSAKTGAVDFFRNHRELVPNPDWTTAVSNADDAIKVLNKKLQSASRMRDPEFKTARIAELDRQANAIQESMNATPRFVKRGKTVDSASLLKQHEEYKGIDITPARNADEFAILNRLNDDDGTLSRLMSDMTSEQVKNQQKSPGWTVLPGSDPNWEPTYLRVVNQQFRNSPSMKAALMIDDEAKLAQWIEAHPKEWKLFGDYFKTPEEYARVLTEQADHYFPSAKLKSIAIQRDVTNADLKEFFPDASYKPNIHGPRYRDLDHTDPNSVMQIYKRFSEWWFKWASDVPEQVMARHPLFNQRFRDHMKEQIDNIPEGKLTLDRVNTIRRNSVSRARKDTADTLFDLSVQSGASESFRLFSPFFSAWEDTMTKWGKLFLDNPDQAVNALKIWNAPNQAGMVVDSEGNVVKNGASYDENGKVIPKDDERLGKGEYMILPNFLGYVGLGEKDQRLRISKNSLNIVFQGDPAWLPGSGPLVAVPMNEIVKRTSLVGQVESNPILSYFLPYGTTNDSVPLQLAPSWARQLANLRPTSDMYAQQYALFAAGEDAKWRSGDRKSRPKGQEIADMVNNHFVMRALLSNAAPVSVRPDINGKLQFYVDQFHRIRNEYYKDQAKFKAEHKGMDWEQFAYNQFPDYFALSIDLNQNTTGIIASDQAFDAAKKYAKYIAPNPEYGWAIVGPDNVGAFDPNVRDAELSQAIGFGQSSAWRGKVNPVDALKRTESERGWIKYNQLSTLINMAMEKRGNTNLNTKANADLRQLKAAFVSELANENGAWRDTYGSLDQHKVDGFVDSMVNVMSQDKTIANRADMRALATYAQARQIVRSALEGRKSKSLDNPANADLAEAWGSITSALKANNLGFERIFNRMLEHDDLNRSLLGVGVDM